MKFKKRQPFSDIRGRSEDKVVIASEQYTGEDRPYYLCSFCNQTLIRLTDAGMNNTTFWCRSCQVEFNPEQENLRKESKIVVPDRNIEPAVASVDVIPDVSIRHEPELKGAFKALKEKGLKIKDYREEMWGLYH